MVKEGYKQTEIGVIPEDWEVKPIGIFTDATAGGTPSTSHPEYWNGNILWMSSGELHNRRIFDVVGRITESGYKNSSTHIIPQNCVLIGLAGQGKTRGTVAINYVQLCTNQSIAAIFPSEKHSTEFLYQSLWNRYDEIRELSSGDGGRGGLNLRLIKNLPCVFPSLPEQNCIAEALSDVDSMISSLEKLIAKKKAVKQGTMQELLTGKKRLDGFDGKWEAKTLDDIANIFDDHRIPVKESERDKMEGSIPYCGANGIVGYVNNYTIDDNIILIAEDGGYFDEYASRPIAYKMSGKCWVNNHAHIIKAKAKINQDYLFYCLVHRDIRDFITSGTRSKLNKAELLKISISLPIDTNEQTAIASILSDMDNEIETLEEKLAKTRQLKQGMMQQLLTGKIRLVSEEKATAAIPVTEQTDSPHSRSRHNQQFDDAVMIAAIVNAFYSKYPLGRKKVQKLLYLLRRKQQEDISAFKKKAAGPYADEVRYKGGEPIARKQGYIATATTQKGTAFARGKAIDVALHYIEKWQMQSDIDWLVSTFKYTNTNDLELYATIDMAICDLQHEGIAVSVDSVKDLIRSNKEWKAKLTKTYFSDADIARAITMCKRLYSS